MNFHENYIEEKDTSSLDSLIFFNEPCTATIVISFFFHYSCQCSELSTLLNIFSKIIFDRKHIISNWPPLFTLLVNGVSGRS